MSTRRVVVYGEGPHELGHDLGQELNLESLPALPGLVHRILGSPSRAAYTAKSFLAVPAVHGRGSKFAKKAKQAIREAGRLKFHAAAIVIDRDQQPNAKRIVPLRRGRDDLMYSGFPPCAVGVAIETFDAWMIADRNAIKKAGGDQTKAHGDPESLTGKKGTGKHPKDVADAIFGTTRGAGLGPKYATVAEHLDLALLETACPKGFKPFADEVRERIEPVLTSE